MKRFICIILTVFSLFSLVACDNDSSDNEKSSKQKNGNVNTLSKSVVKISSYDEDGMVIENGTAFFTFDSQTLVTNYHIVKDAYKVKIFDKKGREFDVPIIYNFDKTKDIAILNLNDENSNFTPLNMSVAFSMKNGDKLTLIQSKPNGKIVTSSAKYSNFYIEKDSDLFFFSSSIDDDNGGSPLFDKKDNIIGITTGVYNDEKKVFAAISCSDILNLYEQEPVYKKFGKKGVLRVGTTVFEPYGFKDADGNWTGVEVDILTSVAEKLNMDLKFYECEFDQLINRLTTGDVDLVASALNRTEERLKIANASIDIYPYYPEQFFAVFYTSKDNPELTQAVDNAISELQLDGTIDKILEKYDNEYDTKQY